MLVKEKDKQYNQCIKRNAGGSMSEQKKPKKQKPRWWTQMDGSAFIMVLCFLFGVYMIVKGVIGVIAGQ